MQASVSIVRNAVLVALVAAGTMVSTGGPAEARRGSSSFKGSAALTATSADADARGTVKVGVKGDDGRFDLSAQRLDRKATYEVIVGGVKIATFTTSGGGSGKARLRTRPRGRDGVLGFDPRSADVVVRAATGADVLFGTVSGTTKGNDDGDVICCVPDDRGTECEDRTPAECAAEGGIVSTATSCVPNPCEGATPPAGGDIVCCIPDDSGTECEDRTQAECAAQGGTVVGANSCDPNPCAAAPPSDPDVQCCLPDDDGHECEDRTPAECAAQGGVNVGAGVCQPDACAGLAPPPTADVRCCLADDSGTECEDRTAAECAAEGGVDRGVGVCAANSCDGVTF
ncbi:MAG: hypothetical protein IT294_11575 [Deltaproteobacteria bacterium]|nr:hypothetical protein [Deltaproteobacteria bacterium]